MWSATFLSIVLLYWWIEGDCPSPVHDRHFIDCTFSAELIMRNLLYCVNTYIYYINGTCSNELHSHCCDLIGWAALPRGRYALPSMCRCTEHVYSFVPETIHATHQFTCVCSLAWKCRTTNAVIVGTASKGCVNHGFANL